MSDAARTKAIDLARSFDPRSTQSRIEMLSQVLDAYAAEQTAALRLQLAEADGQIMYLQQADEELRAEVERLRAALDRQHGFLRVIADEECMCYDECPRGCERCDACIARALLAAPEVKP